MYKVKIEKHVLKKLEKINDPDYTKIKKTINSLANDPRPTGYTKLKGRPGYRVRQGDYRIIYEVSDGILTVFVIDLGHRKDVYE